MGLSNHIICGQPLAISLAAINLPFIASVGVSWLLAIIGIVISELGVGNVVNRLSSCETFFIEGTCNNACDVAPFTLQFWEGASKDGGSLRVALMSTSPAFMRPCTGWSRSQWVGVLFVWSSVCIVCMLCGDLCSIHGMSFWSVWVMR